MVFSPIIRATIEIQEGEGSTGWRYRGAISLTPEQAATMALWLAEAGEGLLDLGEGLMANGASRISGKVQHHIQPGEPPQAI